jgi:nitroimidazol reductase NimA-like FMN-containing flavoprotein (pyridoxamine 5'-phosphate oxidase superfamily)
VTKALNESEVWAVINAGRIGRLGCVDHDEPYVVPINYLVEDGRIYSHSLPGRKISALRSHPRACLQVDQIQNDFHWQSAIAFGSYEEVVDAQKRTIVLRQLLDRFPDLTPVESQLAREGKWDVVVFCLHIDKVTGVAEE